MGLRSLALGPPGAGLSARLGPMYVDLPSMSRELSVIGPSPQERGDLKPDCERCCGLCCVAPAFALSPDFALDKAPGQPCPNLTQEYRCAIHRRLRAQGFRGCVAYDCFGAGQKVSQVTFQGQDWRQSPLIAGQMFEVFGVMRQLHALLLYLSQALALPPARPLAGELGLKLAELEGYSQGSPVALLGLDVAAHKKEVHQLLLRVSDLVRQP
ncbi:MAG: hypothetical protein NVSMB32_03360 [Actinomycetota bacterium]